ncbi:DUF1850 domain-containing protein [Azoarcus sp. L1K30]|uniref:DUF1850 domain-containing protein n=1 Tax=Azoarcus sp. L1K30 TaxID=2820277 RepID=UPI001B81DE92|nr:DUF1850 domain-containing protein [Azoarcus sp. L1K30]MBR0566037.1 DUF1850 domain-containing protein [Azoarcus sp. L1K30]
MAVCLANAVAAVAVAATHFTLGWTHSIEKILWEEDWRVQDTVLVLDAVRVRGYGAGMEPAPEAVLRDGVWEWHPRTTQALLRLTRSAFTADYQWCVPGSDCVPMSEVLPSDGDVTEVRACDAAARAGP